MRKIIFSLTFLIFGIFSFGQSKTVKIILDSQKIYFRFFYKNYKSDEIINDTVYLECRKISIDSFYLDKFLNNKKVWTKTYKIELANDRLNVTTRTHKNGKSVFIKTKEKYYNAIEL
ncbi:MAG: hypothetical protein ABIN36_15935 [Ferruginibacter sp.]